MLSSFLAVTLACGCVTVEMIPADRLRGQQFGANSDTVAHIRADNWGWYLFKYIPLITGNVSHPQFPSLFAHTVRLESLVDEIARRSAELGATVDDLHSTDKSSWQAITFVFWIREVEVSANLSKPRPSADP